MTPRSVIIVKGCGTFLRTQNDSLTSSTKRSDQKSAPRPAGGWNFSRDIATERMDEAGSLSDAWAGFPPEEIAADAVHPLLELTNEQQTSLRAARAVPRRLRDLRPDVE